uniref:Uncharacterized protein n=1 Tax=Anguilla anguilla TaxID=7936 RepID=A0A0E9WXR1_ANGAN
MLLLLKFYFSIFNHGSHIEIDISFVSDSWSVRCLWSVGGNRSTRSKPTQARGERVNS